MNVWVVKEEKEEYQDHIIDVKIIGIYSNLWDAKKACRDRIEYLIPEVFDTSKYLIYDYRTDKDDWRMCIKDTTWPPRKLFKKHWIITNYEINARVAPTVER